MSRIMVDDLVHWGMRSTGMAGRTFNGKASCHLTTDGPIDELHAFAIRIGMRREWFQKHAVMDHYDLTATRRAAALKAGAVYVSAREQALARRAARAEVK